MGYLSRKKYLKRLIELVEFSSALKAEWSSLFFQAYCGLREQTWCLFPLEPCLTVISVRVSSLLSLHLVSVSCTCGFPWGTAFSHVQKSAYEGKVVVPLCVWRRL